MDQGSVCSQPRGTCLSNQIKDLREEDLQRLRDDMEPNYFLHSQGLRYEEVTNPDNSHVQNSQLFFPVEEV